MGLNLSAEAKKMLRERRGYRCESAYGSKVRTPSDVVRYEYYDLDNQSDYVQNQMIEALKLPKYTTPDEVFLHIEQKYDETHDALWLATKDTAKKYYCGKDETPDEYKVPRDAIVLQDLGYDGTLFLIKKGRR